MKQTKTENSIESGGEEGGERGGTNELKQERAR
jgi:hypothetical protein